MFAWKRLPTNMPWSACSRLVQTKMGRKGFPTATPDRIWPFWWPVVGGDTCSSPAPILGPVKKSGFVALFKNYFSWGRIWCQNVCVDCASGIFEGGGVPPSRINHDTETQEISFWPSWTVEGDMATFFFQDPSMIGATSSRENVPPPTTGPRKGNNDWVFP